MTSPRNLDELRTVQPPGERARAALGYITARQDAIREAQRIRDEAIAAMLDGGLGATATAREAGVSLTHVKQVRRRQASPGDGPTARR